MPGKRSYPIQQFCNTFFALTKHTLSLLKFLDVPTPSFPLLEGKGAFIGPFRIHSCCGCFCQCWGLREGRGDRRPFFSHDGSTKLMEVFMQSETKELIYSIYTRIQMTHLYICQLIIIRNCNVIMMSKISCFWISPKFHHLFGPGRPGFIELLPRDMEPTRRCLACSCLWCYACGCICGISDTSFLNIF